MNKSKFEEFILQGDQLLLKRNYDRAFEQYEMALTSLVSENIKDKRSKAIGNFAGWTAGFLSGGLGFEDLKKEIIPEEVLKLAKEREEARKNKNFKKSDELRAEINSLGYDIKDLATQAGTDNKYIINKI